MFGRRAICPKCRREFAVSMTGAIRSHWCEPISGDGRTVKLVTGGTLTVSLAANWMAFDEDERQLLVSIIDALAIYEVKHPPPDEGATDPAGATKPEGSQGESAHRGFGLLATSALASTREHDERTEHRCGVRGFADSGDECPGCR